MQLVHRQHRQQRAHDQRCDKDNHGGGFRIPRPAQDTSQNKLRSLKRLDQRQKHQNPRTLLYDFRLVAVKGHDRTADHKEDQRQHQRKADSDLLADLAVMVRHIGSFFP